MKNNSIFIYEVGSQVHNMVDHTFFAIVVGVPLAHALFFSGILVILSTNNVDIGIWHKEKLKMLCGSEMLDSLTLA